MIKSKIENWVTKTLYKFAIWLDLSDEQADSYWEMLYQDLPHPWHYTTAIATTTTILLFNSWLSRPGTISMMNSSIGLCIRNKCAISASYLFILYYPHYKYGLVHIIHTFSIFARLPSISFVFPALDKVLIWTLYTGLVWFCSYLDVAINRFQDVTTLTLLVSLVFCFPTNCKPDR